MIDSTTAPIQTRLAEFAQRDVTLHETSWYVDDTTSTNDPAGATELTLSDENARLTDIDVVLSDTPANTYLEVLQMGHNDPGASQEPHRADRKSPDVFPMFLSAGETTRQKAYFRVGCDLWEPVKTRCAPYDFIQVFGSDPDVVISDVTKALDDHITKDTYAYMFRTTASPDAVEGDRLVVVSAGGKYEARLIGIHVLGNTKKPVYIEATTRELLLDKFDFTTIDPFYWKN